MADNTNPNQGAKKRPRTTISEAKEKEEGKKKARSASRFYLDFSKLTITTEDQPLAHRGTDKKPDEKPDEPPPETQHQKKC